MNSLGTYLRDEMAWRDWSLSDLSERTGVDEGDLLDLFDGAALPALPCPTVLLGLATALMIPVSEIVLRAGAACGLPIETREAAQTLDRASNEDLTRELRRRLALGASGGGYLSAVPKRMSALPQVQAG